MALHGTLCRRSIVLTLCLPALGLALDARGQVDAEASDWSTASATLIQQANEAQRADGDSPDTIRRLEQVARQAVEMGEPKTAVDLYERAQRLRQAAGLGDDRETADAMERLAEVLRPLGRLDRAEELLRGAFAIRMAADAAGSAKLRVTLGRLSAVIAEARPDDAEAERLILQKLELGDTYQARRELARFYDARGDHEQKLVHLQAALTHAEDHPRNRTYWVGPALGQLARAYGAAGMPDLAETYWLRALRELEAVHGSRHPHLIWVLRELGAFYVEGRRWVEAEGQLIHALELQERAYGGCDRCNRGVLVLLERVQGALGTEYSVCVYEDHGDEGASFAPADAGATEARLAALDELASARMEQKEFAAARRLAEESLELREQTYGIDSLEAVSSLTLLARINQALGRVADEAATRRRQLAVYELRLPPDDPAIADVLHAMARVARHEQQPDEALRHLTRESYIREAAGQNLRLARITHELGGLLRELGDERAAGGAYRRAADLWELLAGRETADYLRSRVEYAESLRVLGMADQAEATLLELAELESGRESIRPPLLLDVLERLLGLYEESGRSADAQSAAKRIGALDPTQSKSD